MQTGFYILWNGQNDRKMARNDPTVNGSDLHRPEITLVTRNDPLMNRNDWTAEIALGESGQERQGTILLKWYEEAYFITTNTIGISS